MVEKTHNKQMYGLLHKLVSTCTILGLEVQVSVVWHPHCWVEWCMSPSQPLAIMYVLSVKEAI